MCMWNWVSVAIAGDAGGFVLDDDIDSKLLDFSRPLIHIRQLDSLMQAHRLLACWLPWVFCFGSVGRSVASFVV